MDDCDKRLTAIEGLLNKIFKILNGCTDDGGLVTKVALQEQKLEDLPSPSTLKFYASIGGGVIMVLALLGIAIVSMFTK
jgi:hypothetical protein